MMRALALVLVLALPADAYSLLDTAKSDLQRCYRRCERNNPPLPSPIPTHSPTPVQCESIGTGSVKVFTPGEMRTFCFTAPPGGLFLEVNTQNHGNAQCAAFWLQMYSPTGAVSEESTGSQVAAVMARVPGRYVLKVKLNEASNVACSTLTFTVR